MSWSQPDLAEAAGLTRETIANVETGAHTPHPKNRGTLRAALETAGVVFIYEDGTAGPGVRLRKS